MSKEKYLNLRITPEMHEALQELADNDRRTLSDYTRIILEDFLAEKGYKIQTEAQKRKKNKSAEQ